MADKRGPKGPRNKVRQVVLVDGHPGCIFETKNRVSITIKYRLNDKEIIIRLGSIGPDKVNGLKQIPGIEVIEELKPYRRSKRLPSVIAVKTTKTSTQLTVAAIDQEALDRAVGNIARFLAENGSDIHERCQWVCKIDKGKPAETSSPAVQIEPVQKMKPVEEQTVKDRIMDYMKTRSSFSIREISSVLNIPEQIVRDVLVDLRFVIPERKSNKTKATMGMSHATG